MNVILLQNIKKLGSTGDIVKVAKGFARNYLLTNKLALTATRKNEDLFKEQRINIEEANSVKKKEAISELAKIINQSVVITRAAADDGRLYGAVRKKDIADSLLTFGAEISGHSISLEQKIKTLGIYKVLVHLADGVETTLNVVVARSKEEGKKVLDNLTETSEKSVES